MKKAQSFSPETINALQLKEAVTGGGIHPVFIGYQEPIENIKF
ncbi:hypothetical protein [Pseudoalteromonas rubra]|nr:hypothetical protein [Pseudoalteromonas rubra]